MAAMSINISVTLKPRRFCTSGLFSLALALSALFAGTLGCSKSEPPKPQKHADSAKTNQPNAPEPPAKTGKPSKDPAEQAAAPSKPGAAKPAPKTAENWRKPGKLALTRPKTSSKTSPKASTKKRPKPRAAAPAKTAKKPKAPSRKKVLVRKAAAAKTTAVNTYNKASDATAKTVAMAKTKLSNVTKSIGDAVSPAPAAPTPPAKPKAASGNYPPYTGKKPCKLATKGRSPVAEACSKGGERKAKSKMKVMVKMAKKKGMKTDCDDCHPDDEYDELTKRGRADFERMVKLLQ